MKKKTKKLLIILPAALVAALVVTLLGGALFVTASNEWITISEYTVADGDIPEAFEGFRILQISDLHNEEFGKDNKNLIEKMKKADPDIIVITGDIVDSYSTDVQIALDLAENAVGIAPTYYVTGNHEARIGDDYSTLEAGLLDLGVIILSNNSVTLERDTQSVILAGLSDPAVDPLYEQNLSKLLEEKEGYTVLLSHRPELFDLYVKHSADLVFSGHAHGGQFIIPGIGGLYAPGQGILPEYYEGVHTEENTAMVISRGLGNSAFPLRINNRPELVLVTLSCKE